MHFSPAAIAMSTTLALVSSAGLAQSQHEASPQSVELVADGMTAEEAGELDRAFGLYISALVYDPHNAAAYVAMGNVAQKQNLNGSAIRYYGRALELAPNDEAALVGQGQAYVAKGAIKRAEANLQQLKLVCASACDSARKLKRSIAAGPPEPSVDVKALETQASVEENMPEASAE